MNRIKYLIIAILMVSSTINSYAQINRQYVYYVGQELIKEEKYKSAIDMLNVLLRADSTSTDGYFLRGIAKYNLGDLVGAKVDFSNTLKTNSVFTRAYQYRAITNSSLGDYDSAIKDFESAIDIRPDQEGIFYSRGITFFLNQQFDKAIQDFDYFIRRKPNVAEAYINRGSSYLMLKDTTEAFYNYDKAIKVNRFDPSTHLRRGILYLHMNRLDSAYIDLSESIRLDSLNIPAYFNRALVHANDKRPTEAIKDFGKSIEIDSTNSLIYFNRALLLTQIGDDNKAMEDYDKVAYYSPRNVLVYFNRGILNNKLGNVEDAERDFTKAIELYPDFANAYINRANVRYRVGDMQGSKSDHDIAQKKISEYRHKLTDESFSIYADTSKTFNSLLSFNTDFRNKDFDNVHSSDVDVKLLPMHRLTPSKKDDNKISNVNRYQNSAITQIEKIYSKYDAKISPLNHQLEQSTIKAINKDLSNTSQDNEEIIFTRAMTNHAIKQYTMAINGYNQAISQSPSNAFYYMNRAVANAEMIEFISKIDHNNHKLIIDADPVNQLKNREVTYNYNDALTDINRAISLNKNIAQFYYNKGYILHLSGNDVEAIDNYTKAIELHPYMAEAYYNRGLIQIYLKELNKGFLDLSKAGELGIYEAYEVAKRYSKLLNNE